MEIESEVGISILSLMVDKIFWKYPAFPELDNGRNWQFEKLVSQNINKVYIESQSKEESCALGLEQWMSRVLWNGHLKWGDPRAVASNSITIQILKYGPVVCDIVSKPGILN